MLKSDDEEEPVKHEEKRFRTLDDRIDEELLKARRIFFCTDVNMESAKDAIRKLWYLELTDPGKPILLVINSPGGAIDAGFAIWDTVKMISSPVTTLVTGLAASMGSVLSLCAAPKKRFATPNARIMIHQPRVMGLIQGQATDLQIQAKEMIRTRNTLVQIYADKTGKDFKSVEKAIDRDTWMTPEEAKEFGPLGLLDGIASSFKDIGF